MSRGIGRLQQEILAVVEENAAGGSHLPPGKVACLNTIEIIGRLRSRSQPRAVRRSLAGLAERGLLVRLDYEERDKDGWFAPLSWTTPEELARAEQADVQQKEV